MRSSMNEIFVGAVGIEPTWPSGQRILSPSRLPVPPRARIAYVPLVCPNLRAGLPMGSAALGGGFVPDHVNATPSTIGGLR